MNPLYTIVGTLMLANGHVAQIPPGASGDYFTLKACEADAEIYMQRAKSYGAKAGLHCVPEKKHGEK
jgi:hypothetical protein